MLIFLPFMKSSLYYKLLFFIVEFLVFAFYLVHDYLKLWKLLFALYEYLLSVFWLAKYSEIFWFFRTVYLLVHGLLRFSLLGLAWSPKVTTLVIYFLFNINYWDLLNNLPVLRYTFLSLLIILDSLLGLIFSFKFK